MLSPHGGNGDKGIGHRPKQVIDQDFIDDWEVGFGLFNNQV